MNRSKYNSKKYVDNDGIKWDSKKEYNYYQQLLQLEKENKIKDIERQVEYILIPKQVDENSKFLYHPIKYKLDFKYFNIEEGKYHYVDVKGFRTVEYKLKKKLMYYIHRIKIEEV